jgi:voltage-gated potassium channel
MFRCCIPLAVAGESTDSRPDSALEKLFYHEERVRFIYWRQFSQAKTAVILAGFVAILSFITGLSTLSQETLVLEGPLAALLPDITEFVRFAGVFFAFLLALVTFGLSRAKRLAWYLSMGSLPVVAAIPLLTLETTHMPLLFLVLVTLPVLVYNRGQFDQPLDLSPLQIASLSSIAGVLVYGTVGSYGLREQFVAVETWSDAFYYVVITVATVGYGDITPVTPEAKWFSLSVVILGTGSFTAAIGSLVVPAIEDRMASAVGTMTPRNINLLEDHVLVLGYSDITESLLEEIGDEQAVVVITDDQDRAATLDETEVNVLTADPTDEASLEEARIADASGVVVATRDDAEDVLAVLAARTSNPDIYIVAAANDRHNVTKLEEVGADEVISPMAIGGRLLGRSVVDGVAPDSLFGSDTAPGIDGGADAETDDGADAEADDRADAETDDGADAETDDGADTESTNG